jgi:hypothetical protein
MTTMRCFWDSESTTGCVHLRTRALCPCRDAPGEAQPVRLLTGAIGMLCRRPNPAPGQGGRDRGMAHAAILRPA